jgi:hypothetical protein
MFLPYIFLSHIFLSRHFLPFILSARETAGGPGLAGPMRYFTVCPSFSAAAVRLPPLGTNLKTST